MRKAKDIIFVFAMIVLFLAVAGMETGNVLICAVVAAIAAVVAWVCVDKTNSVNLRW